MTRWSVIACDQFTSQPEYWAEVKSKVGDYPSTYNLILPEIELHNSNHERIEQINSCMKNYLDRSLFHEYQNAYIYVERKLLNGATRKGIIGVIDLEEYDYRPGYAPRIRATERTVTERIPPRKAVRKNAALELSHVILLCDDQERTLIEPLELEKQDMKKIYDFDLMLGGGNIKGWLVNGEYARNFDLRMKNYIHKKSLELSFTFAIGDGNHSLAAAKACYEDIGDPEHPARWAMVELENLHDDALKFEPIHRIVKNINPDKLLCDALETLCVKSTDGQVKRKSWPIRYYSYGRSGTLYIDKEHGPSALSTLQNYLDLKNLEIDYIHGLDALKILSEQPDCIGFEMPEFDYSAKLGFFQLIEASGTLPRKSFSMGHAQEKRYYLEARKIIL